MAVSADNLRFILGLKLRTLRQAQGASLKTIAERSGLSISYLSEIEKGKKYPSPDKLLDLAGAFDVAYDDLVSLRVTDELDPLKEVFSSTLVQEFPLELFGLEPQDVFGLVADQPTKAGALIRTFVEVGRAYDMQVEHFLFAALRSFQQMQANYFEDLEDAAAGFRRRQGWGPGAPVEAATLRDLLERRYGYTIERETLAEHDDLAGLRSVYVETPPPLLHVNRRLTDVQLAFVYGREIGYHELGIREPVRSSSWLKVESFEQVLNHFRASYFAGALLIDQAPFVDDVAAFFARPTWNAAALRDLMARYRATPEMVFYRLTELVPRHFGLSTLYFTRFFNHAGASHVRLTKVLNMTEVPIPHGLGPHEHLCRRWLALGLLDELAEAQQAASTEGRHATAPPLVQAQRSRFLSHEVSFFEMATARPLALRPHTNACVTIGFRLDDAFRRQVRFWEDEAVPRRDVNLTCERCPLSRAQCRERVAPSFLHEKHQRRQRKTKALAALVAAARQRNGM